MGWTFVHRSRSAGVVVVVVGLAIVASTATAAWAKPKAAQRVRAAVANAQEYDGYRADTVIRVDGAVMRGEGTYNRDGSALATMDAGPLFGAGAVLEQRVVGGIAYVNFGAILDDPDLAIPRELVDRPWVRLDFSALVGGEGASLDPTNGQNPSTQIAALGGIEDVQLVGPDVVRGVRTTEYRGTVSLDRAREAADLLPEELRNQQRDALESLFGSSDGLPVRVWLDGENQFRRMTMRSEVDGISVAVDMTIVEFGMTVEVAAPPEDETIDYDEFLDLIESAGPVAAAA